jgi:hypothetical protein
MGARTQRIDRGAVSRYRCASAHEPASCFLVAPAQHTSPEQACRALCFGMRGRMGESSASPALLVSSSSVRP